MDLQFLIFLVVIWFITWIIKKLPQPEKEKHKPIIWEEVSLKFQTPQSPEKKVPEQKSPVPQPPKPQISQPQEIPGTNEVKPSSGIKLQNLLKSKSSLREVFLITEILDKPLCEKEFWGENY